MKSNKLGKLHTRGSDCHEQNNDFYAGWHSTLPIITNHSIQFAAVNFAPVVACCPVQKTKHNLGLNARGKEQVWAQQCVSGSAISKPPTFATTIMNISHTGINMYSISRNGDGYLEKEEILAAVPSVVRIAHIAHLRASVDLNPQQVQSFTAM